MRTLLVCWLWFLPIVAVSTETLSYLNDLRRGAGLQPLHANRLLAKAAKAHARYALRVQRYSHHERKGIPGYTGKTPADRAVYAGYPCRFVMENIAVNTIGAKSTVDNLLSAIYHRFLFLGFDIDEIGQGDASTRKKRAIQQVHVFDMGARAMASLCRQEYTLHNGIYYLTGLCADRDKKIPQSAYEDARATLRKANGRIVIYPYANQHDVPPAFYNETPDPLPGYKVSGFPVSVEFNPYYFHKIKMLSFKLYNDAGKEIKSRLIDHLRDPNGKLEPNEYALMPLARLRYATQYRAVFDAVADGKRIHKSWVFTTRSPTVPLYRIRSKKEKIEIGDAKKIWLYFVPRHRRDILKKVRHTKGLKIRFVDQNTLEVTLPKRRPHQGYRIMGSGREVRF